MKTRYVGIIVLVLTAGFLFPQWSVAQITPVFFEIQGGLKYLIIDGRALRDGPASDYRLCGDNSWDYQDCWSMEYLSSRNVFRLALTEQFRRDNAKHLDRPLWLIGRRENVNDFTGEGWWRVQNFVDRHRDGEDVDLRGVCRKSGDDDFFLGLQLGSDPQFDGVGCGCGNELVQVQFDPWYVKRLDGIEYWFFKNPMLTGIWESHPPAKIHIVGPTVGWDKQTHLEATYWVSEQAWGWPATEHTKDLIGRDIVHPIQLVFGDIGPFGDWAEIGLFARTARGWNIPESRLRQIGLDADGLAKILVHVKSSDNGNYFGNLKGEFQTPFTRATLPSISKTCGQVVSRKEVEIPAEFALHQNYPNPFNPVTTIGYDLPAAVPVTLEVYDMLGRKVEVLDDGLKPAGTHDAVFDGHGLPSGVYLYRLRAGSQVAVKTMQIVK